MKTIDVPMAEEPLLKADEVSYRLRVSTRTLHRWCRKGQIPAIKIGRAVLFRWSEITAHLIKRATEEKRLAEQNETSGKPSEDFAMRNAAEEVPEAVSLFQPDIGADEITGDLDEVEGAVEADVKKPEDAKT